MNGTGLKEPQAQRETARVLVADDDRAVRESIAEILDHSGFDVTTACDGQEALEQIVAGGTDAVVLDLKMPRLDGLAVLERLQPPPPPPGVVLVTAFEVATEVRGRLGPKVTKVLRKPVPPRLLIEAVDDAVRASRLRYR